MTEKTQDPQNAPTLLAIAVAAHRSGDKALERYAKTQLRDRHGLKVAFTKPKTREVPADA